jgi:hypothetical protein
VSLLLFPSCNEDDALERDRRKIPPSDSLFCHPERAWRVEGPTRSDSLKMTPNICGESLRLDAGPADPTHLSRDLSCGHPRGLSDSDDRGTGKPSAEDLDKLPPR